MSRGNELATMRSNTLRAIVTNLYYAIDRIKTGDLYGTDMESSREVALEDAIKILDGQLAVLSAKLYEMRNK